jgi:hypothetical protein
MAARVPVVWPVWLALLTCAAVLATDVAVYRPARSRLQKALQGAKTVGLSLDPSQRPIMPPTSVQEFVTANSLPESEAASAVQSGLLTAGLLEEITGLASQSGLVVTATEPGLAAQQSGGIVVRAQIRARGTYAELLHYFDLIARAPHLLTVDRFEALGSGGAELNLTVAVTRHVLKRTKPGQVKR